MHCNQKNESEVAQLCLTLCDPMDCSLPGSSFHGIFQTKIVEWVAISFSRGSSQPKDRTQVSHIAGRCFNLWATRADPQKQRRGYPKWISSPHRDRIQVSHIVGGGFFTSWATTESHKLNRTSRMGFEPTRAEHNGLAVHHLNYLATLSHSGIAIKSWNIKKEQNNAICSDMDGPRDCHTEWSKSEKDKCHDIAYMWDIRKGYRWTYLKKR